MMSSCALEVVNGKPKRFPVLPTCMQAALVAMVDESERLKHEQEKIMVRVRPLVLVSSLKQTVNISVVISTPIILLHNLCRLEEHAGSGLEETLLS